MAQQPPKPETRASIERALEAESRKRAFGRKSLGPTGDTMVKHLAKLRDVLDPASFAKVQSQFLRGSHKLSVQVRGRRRRRPGEGSMPALVEPPRGPRPFAGGAAAPLEFD